MTKTRTVLAISFAAIFAISMVMAPVYAVGHLAIEDAKMTKHVKKGTIDLKIKVTAKIPKDESSSFGWALLGWEKFLVVVTHVPDFDDSVFDKKKGAFHTHVLDLGSSDKCVSKLQVLGGTDPGYKNKVGKDKIKVKKVSLSDLGPRTVGPIQVAGFAITIEGGDICVNLKTPVEPTIKLKK